MARRKFYVVWEGQNPGIYDTWEECEAQVKNFPGARYKAYDDLLCGFVTGDFPCI